MKRLFNLILAVISTAGLFGAESDIATASLGPLKRFDPNAVKVDAVVAIHGDPKIGIVTRAECRVQRIANEDLWYLQTNSYVSVMGIDRQSGRVANREIIEVEPDWCVSPDGGHLFAARRELWNGRKSGTLVFECFDLKSGNSLWVMDQAIDVYDCSFSPDGKQVVIVHTLAENQESVPSAVSWYDLGTGVRTRQVLLPGLFYRLKDSCSDYLGFLNDGVYVTRPSKTDARSFLIKNGADVAEPVDIGEMDSDQVLQVRVGGPGNDLVAFYTNVMVRLFRKHDEGLVKLHDIDTTPNHQWSYENNVRFSPDGSEILVSTSGKTMITPTAPSAKPVVNQPKISSSVGDYTADGKFYVFFDDGGGWLFETKTWKKVDRLEREDHPVHCCPITDAGFSTNGNLIVSNDKWRLLLWSQDGRLLAELISPREPEAGLCIEMQSAIFPIHAAKIYAADGWDFLEWDLAEIAARVKRKPVNTPRVVGKLLIAGGKVTRDRPVLMNITMDSKATNLITADGGTVRISPVGSKDAPTPLLIPEEEIMMRPRSFHQTDSKSGILLRSSYATYSLDPDGKEEAERLDPNAGGLDPDRRVIYRINDNSRPAEIERLSLESKEPSGDVMKLPADWVVSSLQELPVSPDGRMIVVQHGEVEDLSSLAVIDWDAKKVIYNQRLTWNARSCRFSPDGQKLVVGSHNRAVYVFDFKKMCAGEK